MITNMKGEEFTPAEVALFDSKYIVVFKQLADLTTTKKKIEEEEKKVKASIQKAMDDFNIKSIDNSFIKITRVPAGKNKVTVDLDAFQTAEPEEYAALLADYPKTVKGKAEYVMFKAKV